MFRPYGAITLLICAHYYVSWSNDDGSGIMQAARGVNILTVVAIALLAGCMDAADRGLGPACQSNLVAAESALGRAKADKIIKAVDWAKAVALIGAARTQQQFSEYQNCFLKARKAREILARHP